MRSVRLSKGKRSLNRSMPDMQRCQTGARNRLAEIIDPGRMADVERRLDRQWRGMSVEWGAGMWSLECGVGVCWMCVVNGWMDEWMGLSVCVCVCVLTTKG